MNFREATSVDRDAILDLRRAAFPKDDREKQQRDFWEWEFVRGYAGPARIFVAEAEGKIVGHLAAIPQRYGELRGALAVDAMTHPDFQRQKVFSRVASFTAERLRDEFEIVTAFQIRDEVRGGMAAGGWVGAGELPVFLRPIIPIARRASDSIRPLRDEEIDSFLVSEKIRQKRTPDFLRWRYRENPHWRYGLDGFFDGDELRAFLIHRPAFPYQFTFCINKAKMCLIQTCARILLNQIVHHL